MRSGTKVAESSHGAVVDEARRPPTEPPSSAIARSCSDPRCNFPLAPTTDSHEATRNPRTHDRQADPDLLPPTLPPPPSMLCSSPPSLLSPGWTSLLSPGWTSRPPPPPPPGSTARLRPVAMPTHRSFPYPNPRLPPLAACKTNCFSLHFFYSSLLLLLTSSAPHFSLHSLSPPPCNQTSNGQG